MLCLPAKTTSNKVDWASSLSKYVARAYSKAQAEAHKEQFRRVDELRRQVAAAAEARLEERTAADARALYVRYYKLLCSMEQRFEVAELRLTFPWRDAFQSGMRQGEADLRFERAAVLFNVASAVTFEAASQNRRSAEGIRRACKLFQEAAGVLHAVAALVGEAAWGASASVDLAPRTLATLRPGDHFGETALLEERKVRTTRRTHSCSSSFAAALSRLSVRSHHSATTLTVRPVRPVRTRCDTGAQHDRALRREEMRAQVDAERQVPPLPAVV